MIKGGDLDGISTQIIYCFSRLGYLSSGRTISILAGHLTTFMFLEKLNYFSVLGVKHICVIVSDSFRSTFSHILIMYVPVEVATIKHARQEKKTRGFSLKTK